ncbi:uncharacterized protein LOC131639605 [Vicia villosa]|uniref:uncharacterized protein LOC131639605 n=1 Tax=Vicia villosa TaxID=3911 RepID=UPI00273BEBD9|nr:uncharacterized protein LOC131639605 [Vicia villosa]
MSLQTGDENNVYFHAYLKSRGNNKSIQFLQRDDVSILTNQKDIETEFLSLYRNLMGTATQRTTHIDIDAMRRAIEEFFSQGRILRNFIRTSVTLIPKTSEAKHSRDYRPIAGCSTVYKIISKIMTKRLGTVLPSIVSLNQSAFIPGQVIHNHIMLAYELLKGYTRKGGPLRCMLQLDLQKAYDMVDWNALETVLHEARRGLRQGDPISPLLFVIMMDYLDRLLRRMYTDPAFKFHSKCEKVGLTNLTFADDILLFCRGDAISVQMLLKTVQTFFESTGLVVNSKKCKVFCGGMDIMDKEQMIGTTGFIEGQLPMSIGCSVSQYHSLSSRKSIVCAGCLFGMVALLLAERALWLRGLKTDNLWVKWIHMYYLKGCNVMEAKISQNSSWVMKRIMDTREELQQHQQLWDRMLSQNRFKMKLMYAAMNDHENLVDWRSIFHRYLARPMANFITWMLCHEKLATKDRLMRFKLITDSVCSICKTADETIAHLFFECMENKEVWCQVLQWIDKDHRPLP